MDDSSPIPYRPITDTPADEPDPRRKGVVRIEPGQPFEHFCPQCGRWGAFGFGNDLMKGVPGAWYCGEHREAGEKAWRASGP
ncbi:hypothetical protein WDZ11_22310 (plasmid) [Roseomonas mucosa]|uniref:hypothetical protein n=1 Tax=Roseomonas mucosa TaxID=207340 RepID=UPI0030D3AC9B